jgi:GT2 family glycosyltransferase
MAGSGACIAVDPLSWSTLGGFEVRFFLFCEDTALSYVAHASSVPLYLDSDVRVRHDGGFKSRGLSLFQLLEYIASERIAWEKFWQTPVYFLVISQVIGVVLRLVRSMTFGDSHMLRVYWRLLNLIMRNRLVYRKLVGADGIRISAVTALEVG